MNAYTIYDKLAESYSLPFYQKNDKMALREFNRAIPESDKDDYVLHRYVGLIFDSDTNKLNEVPTVEVVELIDKKEE